MHKLAEYYCSAQMKTSVMANVSDCGELHNELGKLSDMEKLFAWVPLPYNVLIDVPELDDALLATHSAVESAKVCYVNPQLKDGTSTGRPESCFWTSCNKVADDCLLCRNILYPSVLKEHKLNRSVWSDWSECRK